MMDWRGWANGREFTLDRKWAEKGWSLPGADPMVPFPDFAEEDVGHVDYENDEAKSQRPM